MISRDGRSFVLGMPRNGAASSDASEPSTLEWVRRVRDASSSRCLAGVLLCFSAASALFTPHRRRRRQSLRRPLLSVLR